MTQNSLDSKEKMGNEIQKSNLVYLGPKKIKKNNKLSNDTKELKKKGQNYINRILNTHKEIRNTLCATQKAPHTFSPQVKKILKK